MEVPVITDETQAQNLFEGLDPKEVFELSARKIVLKKLLALVKAHAMDILEALHVDLGRHYHESCMVELYPTINEIKHALAKFAKWAKPEPLKTPVMMFPSTIQVHKMPLGRGYIIAPFNFPIFLSLPYAAMAIAAGNAVLIRPSLKAPACAKVLASIVSELGEPRVLKIVSCSHQLADELTKLRWDKIFYTGSPDVGRHIMSLGASNLIPMTLELGGKSPALVTRHCDIDLAAKRIAFGKCVNCGQICVSPDYVLIESNEECPTLATEFVERYKAHIRNFFGDNPRLSPDYPRLITQEATQRVQKMIKEAEDAAHGDVVGTFCMTSLPMGRSEECDVAEKYVPPTVILNPSLEMQCMQEEIFGPVLAVVEVESLEKMIEFVNERPRPLALYAFTDNEEEMECVSRQTRSGDLVFNDTVLHVLLTEGPFGGVGNSGMGVAHGRYSFLGWCSLRTTMTRNAHGGLSQVDKLFRFAPYEKCYDKTLGVIESGWMFDWRSQDKQQGAGIGGVNNE